MEIAKYALENSEYSCILDICEKITNDTKVKFDWNYQKDIDQVIAQSQVNLYSAECFANYLYSENIEIGSEEVIDYEDATRIFSPEQKESYTTFKQKLLNHIKEANRLAVSVSQYWLIFNCATQLWNYYLPVFKAPNFLTMFNEAAIVVFADLFESLTNSIVNMELSGAELNDTDYFSKIDLYVNFTGAYAKMLEAKGKYDECIRVCDVILGRKLHSSYRKTFDTIKSRAMKSGGDPKKAGGKPVAKPTGKDAKKDNTVVYTPTAEQLMISECFSNLEAAIISKDEKTKLELLKKGTDLLKNYKINSNDESNIEINAELWYKYGVQYFLFNNNACFKYSLYCADNCVKTLSNYEINSISFNRQKWYSVGFLLFSDSIFNLIDKNKQERNSQIKMYFKSIEYLLKAGNIANICKQYYVILQAAKAFYSNIIAVVDQPQNREMLVPSLMEFHKFFINNKVPILYSDPEFLLLFYSLFCICINETKNWSIGEQIVSEALKIIPKSLHHFLLEHKLFYYSKLGKSFMQGLSGVDDKDSATKAKLFVKLAKSSKNKNDQFNAYNKAIEILRTDNNIMVAEVIFELSTWLHKNRYPVDVNYLNYLNYIFRT